MAGFLRRVAGAFVEIESDDDNGPKVRKSADLDDITKGTSELLAQLEGIQAAETGAPTSAGTAAEPPPTPMDSTKLAMTADEVFSRAGLVDGPNAAPRVLKLIAGLSMFPPEQQVVMVRAMDQADDTWSQEEVLEDARARQSALRSHLQDIETERTSRLSDLDGRIESTRNNGKKILEDIDNRISELQIQREAAIADTTTAVNQLEQQKRQVEEQSEQARRGITHVVNALSGLITFFAGGQSEPPA